MFKLVQTIRKTFRPAEKWKMCFLVVLLLIGSLLELAGIGAVLPVITVVISPSSQGNFDILTKLFGVETNVRNITIILCCATILFFLIK